MAFALQRGELTKDKQMTEKKCIKTADGTLLERRYLYLRPEIWKQLYELVTITNSNTSTVITQLISSSGKEFIFNGTPPVHQLS